MVSLAIEGETRFSPSKEDTMGKWSAIIKKAFPKNQRIKAGRPKVLVGSGAPTMAAPVGTLYWDKTNNNAYICTVATGTWVKINA